MYYIITENIITLDRGDYAVTIFLDLTKASDTDNHYTLNVSPLSSLHSWKSSTFMSWCSCRPRRPKCWLSNPHIVFTNASGVVLPNLFSFHSNSSSFVKFLGLLGRLPRQACRSNSLQDLFRRVEYPVFYNWQRILFVFQMSVEGSNHDSEAVWLLIFAVVVLHFGVEFLK